MTIFNALNLIGGLCLFLFGMNLMGQALERRAGSGLRSLLEKMTQNRLMGLLAGLGVTAVIQSSSATTVMVVGFVNSGLMTLRQSIGVIMGANIGTRSRPGSSASPVSREAAFWCKCLSPPPLRQYWRSSVSSCICSARQIKRKIPE